MVALILGATIYQIKNQDRKRKEMYYVIQYVLTDGHGSFIRHDTYSGKYVPVRNKTLAERWEQRSKAQNILKNGLTKQLKRKYHIDSIDDGVGISGTEKDIIAEKDAIQNLHIDEVKKIIDEDYKDTQLDKWESGIKSMTEFVQDAETRKEYLSKEMSDIDKEIIDIQHYIEFNDMNAYQGWMAYKMLQNRLKKRRKIKNELQVLIQLGNCKIDSSMIGDIKNAINEMNNRIYTPRVLKQLFD